MVSRFGSFFGRLLGRDVASTNFPRPHANPDQASGEIISFDWSATKDENNEIHTLLNNRKYEEAETLLLRLHDADPASRRLITLLADVAERRQNWKEALYWWSKISVGRDEKWQTNLPRVRILARQGHRDQAQALLAQVLEKYDGNSTILFFASQVLPELDLPAQVKFASLIRPLLQEITNKNGESTESLITRANISRCEGKLEEVYACLKHAHLLRPQESYIRALALEAGERAGVSPDTLSL